MASWIVHLRLCDALLDKIDIKDPQLFTVGNILPDCGKVTENGYDPPMEVTHFMATKKKSSIKSEEFYNKYCIDKSSRLFPAYLGCYVHLLTDMFWVRDIYYPDKEKYIEKFIENDNFAFEFKKDWYDLDRLFLRDHPDFRAYRLLLSYNGNESFFDHFSPDAVSIKIKEIEKYYLPDGRELDRKYPYLTKERMERFVENATGELYEILRKKQNPA